MLYSDHFKSVMQSASFCFDVMISSLIFGAFIEFELHYMFPCYDNV